MGLLKAIEKAFHLHPGGTGVPHIVRQVIFKADSTLAPTDPASAETSAGNIQKQYSWPSVTLTKLAQVGDEAFATAEGIAAYTGTNWANYYWYSASLTSKK